MNPLWLGPLILVIRYREIPTDVRFMSNERTKPTFTATELLPGATYLVISPFVDYDGIPHPLGEKWRFLAKNFLPYEDGLTLEVELDEGTVQIRLQWRSETQGMIIDRFSDFVEVVQ